ncbi:MAG: beta-ketoacyl synthase chain length factor [Candidatus Competibacteraceae bacterium]|nr:beta-ketoacyl synthase chain length factor [Candidatus Competibacteraceae bacterium]
MAVFVNGIGLCAPGLPDWLTGQSVLTNLMPYQPDVPLRFDRSRLPRNAARRASLTVCLALQAATEALDQAGIDTGSCSAVFACSGGNTAALDALCRALTEPGRLISPNHFNNSVHNAPLGYWAIATGSREPASSVGAYDASFAAGLLDAVALAQVENRTVLLVAFDTPPPLDLQPFRVVSAPFSVALLLGSEASPSSLARLQKWRIQSSAVDSMMDSALDSLRLNNPAARGLPLLQRIALRQSGRITLPYLPDFGLELQVDSC